MSSISFWDEESAYEWCGNQSKKQTDSNNQKPDGKSVTESLTGILKEDNLDERKAERLKESKRLRKHTYKEKEIPRNHYSSGFVLDRRYFSRKNLTYMDQMGYGFLIMIKGMKSFIRDVILENMGSFENKRSQYNALLRAGDRKTAAGSR